MRTIVSTIGAIPYGPSKYLLEIIQPNLNKNIHRVIHSYTFVQEAKTWEIYQDEVQVSHDFKVHRQDAITNIHIKPNSCIDPSITKSVFKGFLHGAHTIRSEKYIKEETQFLVDMFVEN